MAQGAPDLSGSDELEHLSSLKMLLMNWFKK